MSVTHAHCGKRHATKPCLLVLSTPPTGCSADTMSQRRRVKASGHIIQADTLPPFGSPLSPPSVHHQTKTVTQQLPLPESQQDRSPIHPSCHYIFPQSEDDSLDQLAQQFTKLTKLTYDNIIDLYFQDFRKWLPVVSSDSFRREASQYQKEGRLPPADFTVLILAMLLMILPALDPSLHLPYTSQELLYMTTKSAFSQAQASICSSLRLVQVAFLIALREYIYVRPEAAYISMMTCMGLARIVGIITTSVGTMRDAQKTSDSQVEEMERVNLAWAIATLERYE